MNNNNHNNIQVLNDSVDALRSRIYLLEEQNKEKDETIKLLRRQLENKAISGKVVEGVLDAKKLRKEGLQAPDSKKRKFPNLNDSQEKKKQKLLLNSSSEEEEEEDLTDEEEILSDVDTSNVKGYTDENASWLTPKGQKGSVDQEQSDDDEEERR
ncbi:unnamed protein product [Lepeophtheirus salmonis]|uniref:(salmon louse) hypothetical protein n=1 Tax=Lepeophtheirus salmonis TaxID=72036 RepID=A0A7R8CMI5_LEPSM|nr:unnamed protein product [Lepeophtheirus salmonis]CAF2864528.1 unnamed protein product [Lepeophtheirus salmonis]